MSLIGNIISFGAGVGTACIVIPPISEAIGKIKDDTIAILNSREAIDRLCIDKIARWYYDGTLEVALNNILRQAEENRIKAANIRMELPEYNQSPDTISS